MNLRKVIALSVSAAPLVYLAVVFSGLPSVVPVHFDSTGEANRFASKNALWAIVGLMAVLATGLFALFTNMHKIDPKRVGKEQSASLSRIADGLPLFISAINFMIVKSVVDTRLASVNLVFAWMGFLFIFLGNMMFSVKPNSFAGIKVPWTLADDGNWQATHRLAGRVWVIAGLLLVGSAFLLSGPAVARFLNFLLFPMVVIPIAYSFWYFRRTQISKK